MFRFVLARLLRTIRIYIAVSATLSYNALPERIAIIIDCGTKFHRSAAVNHHHVRAKPCARRLNGPAYYTISRWLTRVWIIHIYYNRVRWIMCRRIVSDARNVVVVVVVYMRLYQFLAREGNIIIKRERRGRPNTWTRARTQRLQIYITRASPYNVSRCVWGARGDINRRGRF